MLSTAVYILALLFQINFIHSVDPWDFGNSPQAGLRRFKSKFLGRPVSRRLLATLKDWDLIKAARDNDVGGVRILLDEGININAQDFHGLGPLHWATMRAAEDTIKVLIERGASIDLASKRFMWLDGISLAQGTTPLFIAASLDRSEILEELIAKGADVNRKMSNGWTPLHRAAEQDQYQSTMALLNLGADVDSKTEFGETPLTLATFKGNIEIAQALLNAGSNKEERTSDGDTALHRAAANFHNAKMVKFLSEAGCDTNSQNYEGWTPLHKAAWTKQPEAIQALVDGGAYVNMKDSYGRTPLHIAAARGGTDTVKVLLDLGAVKDHRNNSGRTAKNVICREVKECPNRVEIENLLH